MDEALNTHEQEAKREEVLGEIDSYKEEYVRNHGNEDGWLSDLLNNFHMHLAKPEDLGGQLSDYRRVARMIGRWDTPFGSAASSSLKQSKTPAQFYTDFDQALTRNNIDSEEINRKLRERVIKQKTGDLSPTDLLEIILPVYVDLRVKGYDHDDLTQ